MSLTEQLLTRANQLARRMPRRLMRLVADFPGALPLFLRLSAGSRTTAATPEGQRLVLNPLFHANLAAGGSVAGYEPEMRAAIAALTRPGMTAYDVGANVGVFSLLFAARAGATGRVLAFEPEPNNLQCLRETRELNQLDQLVIDPRAVGRMTGSAEFDRRGGAYSGRLVGDGTGYRASQNQMVVDTVCLDDAIDRGELPPPDIIKIDVEGNEHLVLQGLERTLRTRAPIVICELHAHNGESVGDALALLSTAGYEFTSLMAAAAGRWDPLAEATLARGGHVVAWRPAVVA